MRFASQESIAVTQNFVSSVGLRQCLAFLQTGNPDLVSGCPAARAHRPAPALPERPPGTAPRGALSHITVIALMQGAAFKTAKWFSVVVMQLSPAQCTDFMVLLSCCASAVCQSGALRSLSYTPASKAHNRGLVWLLSSCS